MITINPLIEDLAEDTINRVNAVVAYIVEVENEATDLSEQAFFGRHLLLLGIRDALGAWQVARRGLFLGWRLDHRGGALGLGAARREKVAQR